MGFFLKKGNFWLGASFLIQNTLPRTVYANLYCNSEFPGCYNTPIVKYAPKKYLIKTYGCQANVADSNSMSGILEALGFEKIKPGKKYKNENG